jgi:hypothetical protein
MARTPRKIGKVSKARGRDRKPGGGGSVLRRALTVCACGAVTVMAGANLLLAGRLVLDAGADSTEDADTMSQAKRIAREYTHLRNGASSASPTPAPTPSPPTPAPTPHPPTRAPTPHPPTPEPTKGPTQAPTVFWFDWKFYIKKYPDLAHLGEVMAYRHYVLLGKQEHRLPHDPLQLVQPAWGIGDKPPSRGEGNIDDISSHAIRGWHCCPMYSGIKAVAFVDGVQVSERVGTSRRALYIPPRRAREGSVRAPGGGVGGSNGGGGRARALQPRAAGVAGVAGARAARSIAPHQCCESHP